MWELEAYIGIYRVGGYPFPQRKRGTYLLMGIDVTTNNQVMSI